MSYLFYQLGEILPIIIGVVVGLIVIVVLISSIRGGSPVLVLKEFYLNENEDEFLRIKGRAPGILSWILSKIGIDPITNLVCNKQAIKYEEAAIKYGKKTLNVPLVAVTGVFSGIQKPFGLLVAGIIFAFLALVAIFVGSTAGQRFGGFFLFIIIGAGLLYLYSLKKKMIFKIYNGGDVPPIAIQIGRSIIENQIIDESKYQAAANALNRACLEIHYTLANLSNVENNE